MKKVIHILFVLLSIIFISCKNENQTPKTEQPIAKDKVIKQKQLTINFNFKTNKPGTFRFMMNNIVVDELQKKNIQILEDVIPSTAEDYIVAEFDAGNISNNILINFGNKQPKEVEIISISVSYGEKYFNITTLKDFNKYFAFNKYIDINPDNKTITTKKVDGEHNPVIYLRRSFINMLKKS